MNGNSLYAENYTDEQKQNFEQYLQRKSIIQDVSKEKMMDYLLRIYATPVDNHYGTNIHNSQ